MCTSIGWSACEGTAFLPESTATCWPVRGERILKLRRPRKEPSKVPPRGRERRELLFHPKIPEISETFGLIQMPNRYLLRSLGRRESDENIDLWANLRTSSGPSSILVTWVQSSN